MVDADRRKVEFEWVAPLSALPGASRPVAGFGGGDNPDGSAHLVHFDDVPPFAEFQRRVSGIVADHAPVHQLAVANWAGDGWSA